MHSLTLGTLPSLVLTHVDASDCDVNRHLRRSDWRSCSSVPWWAERMPSKRHASVMYGVEGTDGDNKDEIVSCCPVQRWLCARCVLLGHNLSQRTR